MKESGRLLKAAIKLFIGKLKNVRRNIILTLENAFHMHLNEDNVKEDFEEWMNVKLIYFNFVDMI